MHKHAVLKNRVYVYIERILGTQNIDKNCDSLEEIGIDSSKLYDLILVIESDFGIFLSNLRENYLEVNSVDELCDYIEIELYCQ